MASAAAKRREEVGLDISEGRRTQLAPRNRDDVDRGVGAERVAVTAKQVAQPALRAIARDGGAELARRDETKAGGCAIIREYQQCDEAAGDAAALLLHAHEVGAPAHPIAR